MSLSKKQKARLYGSSTQARPASSTPQTSPARGGTYRRQDFQANPESSQSPYLFAGVGFFIALIMGAYYYGWVLPQMGSRGGVLMPELRFWFDSAYLHEVANALGENMVRNYQVLHRSTGLLFPLLLAGSWYGLLAASQLPASSARINKSLPVLFAAVFITGNFVLDFALANPAGSAVLPAAILIMVRWWLLLLGLLQLVTLVVRLVRQKVDDFAEGKLPGQQG